MVSDDFAAGWLQGFFDGEGSASFKTHSKSGKRHTNRYLSVGNTDIVLLTKCSDYLTQLGISHTKFKNKERPQRKPFYTLYITKAADILTFSDKVGFVSPHKVATLACIVGWINRDKTHYRSAEVYELRQQGLSFRDIANKLGYSEGAHSHLSKIYKLEENQLWQQNQQKIG